MRRINRLTLALVVALFLPGIAAADSFNLSGSWRSATTPDKEGTWTVTAERSGADLNGEFSANGPSDVTQGRVFGDFSDTGDVRFGIGYENAEEAEFVGSITGGVVTGTYTTRQGDKGSWSASIAGSPQE